MQTEVVTSLQRAPTGREALQAPLSHLSGEEHGVFVSHFVPAVDGRRQRPTPTAPRAAYAISHAYGGTHGSHSAHSSPSRRTGKKFASSSDARVSCRVAASRSSLSAAIVVGCGGSDSSAEAREWGVVLYPRPFRVSQSCCVLRSPAMSLSAKSHIREHIFRICADRPKNGGRHFSALLAPFLRALHESRNFRGSCAGFLYMNLCTRPWSQGLMFPKMERRSPKFHSMLTRRDRLPAVSGVLISFLVVPFPFLVFPYSAPCGSAE